MRDDEEQRAGDLRWLAAMPADAFDFSDSPQRPPGHWKYAEIGPSYRPRKDVATIRLDAEMLDRFRRHAEGGRGYPTAIDAALREHVQNTPQG